MNFDRRAAWPLALLLAVRLAVGLTYSLIVPPWEADNEPSHFQYARYLAKHRVLTLPSTGAEIETIFSRFHPPLYYILIAPTFMAFDLSSIFQFPNTNPLMPIGNAGVNYAVVPDRPTGLELEQVLTLRAARAVGVVISTLSVIFVFLTARRLWTGRYGPVWAATVIYAFWPQFIFVGSMVTNDVLIISLAAPVLYLTIRLLQEGTRYRVLSLAALLIFGAILTKLNGLAFVPTAVFALILNLWLGHRAKSVVTLLGMLAMTCFSLLLLSSFEFVTGQILQLATIERFFLNLRTGDHPVGLGSAAYAVKTYFALYGWGNLETYTWAYIAWYILAALGLIGIAKRLVIGMSADRQMLVALWILMAHVISLVLLSVALAIAQQDSNLVVGRYLLPSLPAVSLLLVEGWRTLTPPSWERLALTGIACGFVLLGWRVPVGIIAPAYAKPSPLSPAQAAAMDRSLQARFGDSIELMGYLPAQPTTAGGRARFGLCWQALAPVAENYFLRVEIIAPDGRGYGRVEAYPRDGNYPPSLWTPNQPFCDRVEFDVPPDFPAPAASQVDVRLVRTFGGEALPMVDSRGLPLPNGLRIPLIIRSTTALPQPTHRLGYRFGEAINLQGYDLDPWPNGRGVRLTLHWQARSSISESYKVFAHLRTADPSNYTQSDQSPRGNAYPTNAWAVDETVLDVHELPLPPGASFADVQLYLGMYHPANGERLLIASNRGEPVPNNELRLELIP
jgi:hypothetical protein